MYVEAYSVEGAWLARTGYLFFPVDVLDLIGFSFTLTNTPANANGLVYSVLWYKASEL